MKIITKKHHKNPHDSTSKRGSFKYSCDDPDSIAKNGSLQKSSRKEVEIYLLFKFEFREDFLMIFMSLLNLGPDLLAEELFT